MLVSKSERNICLLIFAACAALSLWFSSVGWKNNLLEGHEFRQTQTALTSYYLQKDGWQLEYPLPLFGPPWSAPLEFPLYQYTAAVVSTALALPLEPAGRLVSLGFFYLALPAFFLLLRHIGIPPHRRWLFLALVLVSPAYAYYSRTFMIESTALCAAAWFLHAYCRALETRLLRWIFLAGVFGSTAASVKITTFAVALVPAAWFTIVHLWRRRPAASSHWSEFALSAVVALGATIPAVVFGFAWIKYGDAVKAESPLGEFLRSTDLHQWTYGTLGQRFSGEFWQGLFTTTTHSTLAVLNLVVVAVLAIGLGGRKRLTAWGLLACFLAGPLVLANLFLVHDYYYYSTGVLLLAALALGWSWLLDAPRVPRVLTWILIVGCLGAQVHSYAKSYFLLQWNVRPSPPELSRVLAAMTNADDVILIYGLDWNPIVPYYAGRRAIMVTNQYLYDHERRNVAIGRLGKLRIGALVVYGDARSHPEFFRMLAESLQLQNRPYLSSNQAQVFIATALLPQANAALEHFPMQDFVLAGAPDAAIPGVAIRRISVASLADQSFFDMMTPRPVEVRVPFGTSVSLVDGQRAFNAHSPTEVIFNLKGDATALHFGFGMLPDAYSDGHISEGMQFLVELVKPNGARIKLFDQYLDPNRHPEDKGMHRADVKLPPGVEGRLILTTLPGANRNISFTWGYWTEVTIK